MTIGGLVFFLPDSLPFSLSLSLSPASGSGSFTTSARRFPSGDQSRCSTPPWHSVTFSASAPPRGSSQTCAVSFSSSRLDRKARYRPSGLQRGVFSEFLLVV